MLRKLQQVQNMVDSLLSAIKKYQHIYPTLATLHWLSVHFRASFKVLIYLNTCQKAPPQEICLSYTVIPGWAVESIDLKRGPERED